MEKGETQSICDELLDRFMVALDDHDSAAMDACIHFPHVRMAEGAVVVYDPPGNNPMDLFDRLKTRDGWHHSAWKHKRVVQFSDDKVHLDVQYIRYREDGSVIGVYDALYIVTCRNGHWGIQARSSFGP